MAKDLAAVAAGGAAGCLCRWLLTDGRSPWLVVAVNLSGALALGLLVALVAHGSVLRPLLGTGFLGGWTTWSALAAQAALDLRGASYSPFVALLAVSVLGGPAAAYAGSRLGHAVRIDEEVP
jgi:CrcB protein